MKRKDPTAAMLKIIETIKKRLDHLERTLQKREHLLEFDRTQRSRGAVR